MTFKSDAQRKGFFANKGNTRVNINPTLETRAKKRFGITQNPLESGFITRKGKFIKLKEHKAIRIVFKPSDKQIPNGNFIDKFLNQTGDLRIQVTKKQTAIQTRRKITSKQLDAIRKTQLNSNPIFFEQTNAKGKIIKSGKFIDFSRFKAFIFRNKLIT